MHFSRIIFIFLYSKRIPERKLLEKNRVFLLENGCFRVILATTREIVFQISCDFRLPILRDKPITFYLISANKQKTLKERRESGVCMAL